ncbi:MAG: metal-sensitive transcriptional regulator [Phycisphaerales bacterium]
MRKQGQGQTSTGTQAGGACGCAGVSERVPQSRGPGGRAAAVDPSLKAANLRQLKRIEGQVRGIAAMIEGDRYCADIITQVSAVRESLHAVARNLMRNHLQHCAAEAMGREGRRRDEMVEELLGLVAKVAR